MVQKFLTPNQEIKLISQEYDVVVGIDEAGRGPWAGPVAVGFFGFHTHTQHIMGIGDSKILTSKQRGTLLPELMNNRIALCLLATAKQIDEKGIGLAITSLISDGIQKISIENKNQRILFLIDGYFKEKFNAEYRFVKKGDSKFYSIAAASIIAKETRDRLMNEFAAKFPDYGFEKHVGYGTRYHRQMLLKHGPCEIHRRSFKPIVNILGNTKKNN